MQDIKDAIAAIQKIEDEHGAFFVGFYDEEDPTLETNNELQVPGMFPRPETGDEDILKKQMKGWAEVENLYALLLDRSFDAVRAILAVP